MSMENARKVLVLLIGLFASSAMKACSANERSVDFSALLDSREQQIADHEAIDIALGAIRNERGWSVVDITVIGNEGQAHQIGLTLWSQFYTHAARFIELRDADGVLLELESHHIDGMVTPPRAVTYCDRGRAVGVSRIVQTVPLAARLRAGTYQLRLLPALQEELNQLSRRPVHVCERRKVLDLP